MVPDTTQSSLLARADLRRRQRELADQRIREEVERLNNREAHREQLQQENGDAEGGERWAELCMLIGCDSLIVSL